MSLFDDLKLQIASNFEKNTLQRCSRWSEKVRFMSDEGGEIKNWSFRFHPWLRQVHDDSSQEIVILKAAQMGFTEYCINRTLFFLDQIGKNVLYALPNAVPDANNFSRARLNPAAEYSPYIHDLFAKSESQTLKITKTNKILYIVGGRSRTGLKQKDVGLVVLDEVDEMSEEAIGLARFRLSGQKGYKQLIMLSTPSNEGKGVSAQYADTSQKVFSFKCPGCSRHLELEYPRNMVITADEVTDPLVKNSHYICHLCGKKISQVEKPDILSNGVWIDAYPDRDIKGYHISQLYSCVREPWEVALDEIRGRYSLASKIEFYNSCLGQTFTPDGAKITDALLNECMGDYKKGDIKDKQNYIITIGIDVGQETHHYVVMGWKIDKSIKSKDLTMVSRGRVMDYGGAKSWGEIINLIKMWKPYKFILDAQPLTREATEVCKQFYGKGYVCFYSLSDNCRKIVVGNVRDESVSVNRTYWLDCTFGKIKGRMMQFPMDISVEFKNHLKAMTRIYKQDDNGQEIGHYVKKDREPDHYAHALNYAMIALGASSGGPNEHID